FSSRRRHTRFSRDWSSDVCSSDLGPAAALVEEGRVALLRGRFPRARTLFQEATDADRRDVDAWRGLGIASERMGLIPEAVDAYQIGRASRRGRGERIAGCVSV